MNFIHFGSLLTMRLIDFGPLIYTPFKRALSQLCACVSRFDSITIGFVRRVNQLQFTKTREENKISKILPKESLFSSIFFM
jgi:hypothetical protein